MTREQAAAELTRIARTQAKIKNGLDVAGIGADVDHQLGEVVGHIQEAAARFAAAAVRQAIHDRLYNIPAGILGHMEATPAHAIKSGLAHFAGAFVEWDIKAARELAADILDDVNDHEEAARLRA